MKDVIFVFHRVANILLADKWGRGCITSLNVILVSCQTMYGSNIGSKTF